MNLISTIKSLLLIALFALCIEHAKAQGSWVSLADTSPDVNAGVMILLSDGTVMVKSVEHGANDYGYIWDRLIPDIYGSYTNGTWSQDITPMNDTRLYFSSRVLKDGRVYVAGGEYGSGGNFGEVYDPVANIWTETAYPYHYIGDANSELLPDGRVLNAYLDGTYKETLIYDPVADSWTDGPTCLGQHDEATWVKLPDNSILFVNNSSTTSERYMPSLNKWIADANLPIDLYDPYLGETGPALLLPDGRAFFLGASGHTAYYTPSGNVSNGTWAAGPDIPNSLGTPDAAAAMMINGKILCIVSPTPYSGNEFPTPAYYYEFNYLSNSFTEVEAPWGGESVDEPCYVGNMLDLPDGSVLYSEQGSAYYFIYQPDGAPLAAGKPTINNITQISCGLFTISGTLFNGISEGTAYGDDWQMATNYPIVRLTLADSVYYARTFNWNATGVQTGSLADTTLFTLPAGLPLGKYSLVVIANGIASDTILFTPFPMLNSTLKPTGICSNSAFNYTPSSDANGATFTWTRAAVPGISNAAITSPQTIDPNEVLVNATTHPVNVIYSYIITANSCSSTQSVTVVVNPLPTVTFTGFNTDTICQTASSPVTLTGHPSPGTFNGIGITGNVFDPIAASVGWNVISYSYADSNGCSNSTEDSVYIEQCTAVNNLDATLSSFRAFPNPVGDILYINGSMYSSKLYRITLANMLGQIIAEKEIKQENGTVITTIGVHDMPGGVYLLTIFAESGRQVFKLLKY